MPSAPSARVLQGTQTRPPQARSGNHSSSPDASTPSGRSSISSQALRKALPRVSAKRPCGIPSWVLSAMKCGIGRGFGVTRGPYLQGRSAGPALAGRSGRPVGAPPRVAAPAQQGRRGERAEQAQRRAELEGELVAVGEARRLAATPALSSPSVSRGGERVSAARPIVPPTSREVLSTPEASPLPARRHAGPRRSSPAPSRSPAPRVGEHAAGQDRQSRSWCRRPIAESTAARAVAVNIPTSAAARRSAVDQARRHRRGGDDAQRHRQEGDARLAGHRRRGPAGGRARRRTTSRRSPAKSRAMIRFAARSAGMRKTRERDQRVAGDPALDQREGRRAWRAPATSGTRTPGLPQPSVSVRTIPKTKRAQAAADQDRAGDVEVALASASSLDSGRSRGRRGRRRRRSGR